MRLCIMLRWCSHADSAPHLHGVATVAHAHLAGLMLHESLQLAGQGADPMPLWAGEEPLPRCLRACRFLCMKHEASWLHGGRFAGPA